jgi:hypothetical protein
MVSAEMRWNMDLAGQVTPKTLAHFDFLAGVLFNEDLTSLFSL